MNIETGWDAPGASFLINMRPTKSVTRAAQRKARIARKHYDADGNEVTAQVVDLVDTVRERKRRDPDAPPTARQIVAAALMRETVYIPGKVIASPESEGKRRDFTLEQFPKHLQWALTMARGVPLDRLEVFGAGVLRDKAPDGRLTRIEAARGLGVSLNQLGVAMAVVSAREEPYVNEKLMGQIEEHLNEMGVPVSPTL